MTSVGTKTITKIEKERSVNVKKNKGITNKREIRTEPKNQAFTHTEGLNILKGCK